MLAAALVAAGVALAVGGVASGASATTGDISGTITDDDGAPVWRACVSAHLTPDEPLFAITTTETDGTYTLADLPPGGIHLRATDCLRSELATTWADATVQATTSVTVDVEMERVGVGFLRATTSPAVPSQIRIDGLPADDWGLTWVQVPAGRHEVSYSDVPGLVEAEPTVVTVHEGQTTTVDSSNEATGFLRVVTDPALPSTIEVDGWTRNDWGVWTELPVGEYGVCFGPVPGFTEPSCTGVAVVEGETTTHTGVFAVGSPLEDLEAHGFLRVTTSPPVPSRVVVDGIPRDTWGLTWTKLRPGIHTVSFTDVPGFETPEEIVVEVHEGQTTTVEGVFDRLGSLRVTTNPPSPATIYVDGVAANDWGLWTAAAPGDHLVCVGAAPSFVPPPCETISVTAGELTQIEMASGGPDTTAPPTPTGLVDDPLHGAVSLVWDRVPARDLAGYHVYDTTGGGGDRLTESPIRDPEYLHSGVPDGTDRTYEVTSIDLYGNESAAAVTGTVTPAAAPITEHCGDIATSETWDDSSVHILTCTVSVQDGATLTIEAGAVVKLPPLGPPGSGGNLLLIYGGLDVNGTPSDAVVVTLTTDDTAAGDTNGDGDATAPAPPSDGQISAHIGLINAGAVDIDGVDMRWGGIVGTGEDPEDGFPSSVGPVTIQRSTLRHNASITMAQTAGALVVADNTIENRGPADYFQHGICVIRTDSDVVDVTTPVTITGNTVRGVYSTSDYSGCEGHGISVVYREQTSPDAPTVANNHVDDTNRAAIEITSPALDLDRLGDNSSGDNTVRVVSLAGTIVEDATLGPSQLPFAIGEGLNPFEGALVIGEGATVTVLPGSTLMSFGGFLEVQGGLDVNGTPVDPVVFTSLSDDSTDGDTDRNGMRTPVPPGTGWAGIAVSGSEGSVAIDGADFRYGTGIRSGPGFSDNQHAGDVEIRNSRFLIGMVSLERWLGSVAIVDNSFVNDGRGNLWAGICVDHRGLDGTTTSVEVTGNDVTGAFAVGSTDYPCDGRGIEVLTADDSTVDPVIRDNAVHLTDNEAIAVWSDRLDVANLIGNTATDYTKPVLAIGGTIVANATLGPASSLELPLVPDLFRGTFQEDENLTSFVTIAPGVTVTVPAGTNMWSLGPGWRVEGTLDVDGATEAPVVFAAYPTLPELYWSGLYFVDGGVGDLVGTEMHDAGVALTIDDGASVTFRGQITGNEFGVQGCSNSSSCTADVTNTDWGTHTGPAPFGTGDEVDGYVEVEPWVGQTTSLPS